MPTEVRLPNLGESIAHARLGQWLKRIGDPVSRGDVIAEVETDKTSVEIESPGDGVLSAIHVPAGVDGVVVGQLLAVLDDGAVVNGSNIEPAQTAANVSVTVAPPVTTPALVAVGPPPALQASRPNATSLRDDDRAATPLARRMAIVAGISIADLDGSGAGGIVTKADVDRAIAPDRTLPSAAPLNLSQAADASEASDSTVVHLSTMRRVAGERLTKAKQQIPHFYVHVDCDMEAVCAVRDDINARSGVKLSLTAFSLRAAALALQKVPAANAVWDNGVLRQFKTVNLAVAVNTPGGLVAPVLRRAEHKPVPMLHAELSELAERARSGKLSQDEYAGGTCTVSNLGMFGVSVLYPIINPPQVCILGIGAVEERPVVRDHTLTVARTMTCTLSADHRALDGVGGAEFLSAFRALVEDPWAMLL